MKRYQNRTPRTAFAIAAVVMSLATMSVFVAVPSVIGGGDVTVVARANQATPAMDGLTRIEVVGSRAALVNVATSATNVR